jgi:glycerophosphoryl diester phosphodiesterase
LQIPVAARGHSLATPELISAAHALDLEVHYWTIKEPEQMITLLRMGADALITDDPVFEGKIIDKSLNAD